MWIHYIEWWKWKYCFFSVHVSHKQEFLLAAFWYLSQISRSSSNERCELTILGYQLGNITNCQENFQVIRDSELTYKGWDIFSRYLRYVFMILKIISIKSIEKNSYFVSCYKNRRHLRVRFRLIENFSSLETITGSSANVGTLLTLTFNHFKGMLQMCLVDCNKRLVLIKRNKSKQRCLFQVSPLYLGVNISGSCFQKIKDSNAF